MIDDEVASRPIDDCAKDGSAGDRHHDDEDKSKEDSRNRGNNHKTQDKESVDKLQNMTVRTG